LAPHAVVVVGERYDGVEVEPGDGGERLLSRLSNPFGCDDELSGTYVCAAGAK
jgi:hypothetical protein